jgi:hypothetical protein
MKPYREKLKDPRWQAKRLAVMSRANFTCECCGRNNETLNVHHLMYSKSGNPWEVDNKWLECLCETCHGARTEADSIDCFRIRARKTKDVISEEDRKDYLLMNGEGSSSQDEARNQAEKPPKDKHWRRDVLDRITSLILREQGVWSWKVKRLLELGEILRRDQLKNTETFSADTADRLLEKIESTENKQPPDGCAPDLVACVNAGFRFV